MRKSLGVLRCETSTLSSDGHTWLRIVIWLPDSTYTRRGVVQVLHGMSEHMGRYEQLARFLAGFGYVVFGHDFIGHGKSVTSSEELGHMPLDRGKEILISDTKHVRKAVFKTIQECDELPLFLFGHSMGSYLARICMTRPIRNLAGVVLCATGNQPYALVQIANGLSRFLAQIKGETYRSSLVASLAMGSFNASIENPRTDYDWLNTDPDEVDRYCDDPLCGSSFSVGAYATLTDVVGDAVSNTTLSRVSADIPLLFIAGSDDPLGEKGKAIKKAVEMYEAQGVRRVQAILYPHMRHEILHEPKKMKVFSDVEDWLTHYGILQELHKEAEKHQDSQQDRSERDGQDATNNQQVEYDAAIEAREHSASSGSSEANMLRESSNHSSSSDLSESDERNE